MRDYGKVHTSFWSSETTRTMSEDARALSLYLLTCSHGTLAGVFRLPDGYVCEDLQWTPERVCKGFEELLIKGFANRCATTKWVWIIKHLEWNPPENPNQKKAAVKLSGQIPDECSWKQGFMRDCGQYFGIIQPPKEEPLSNPSETLPQPVAVAVAVKKHIHPPGGSLPFEIFWKAYPSKVGKGAAEKAWSKAKINGSIDLVLTALEVQKKSPKWIKDGGDYIPNPATWINQRRWEDGTANGEDPGRSSIFAGAIL